MLFNFKGVSPKENLKEFGSKSWVLNNKIGLFCVNFVYLLLACLLYPSAFYGIFLFLMLMPLIGIISIPHPSFFRILLSLQCFWYVPILFWHNRNEVI
jgi:hypothetical protein